MVLAMPAANPMISDVVLTLTPASAAFSSSPLRSRIDLVIATAMIGAKVTQRFAMAASRSALLVDEEETTLATVALAEPCDASA